MKIKGNFYFRLTERENLIGEFTNNAMESRWDIESANFLEGVKGNFDCTFISTWLEDEESFISKLKIEKDETKDGSYKLKWTSKDKSIFYGKGFVVNNVLYGDYII